LQINKCSKFFSEFETSAKSHKPPDRYHGMPTTSWPVIQKHTAKIAAVLDSIAVGDFIEIIF